MPKKTKDIKSTISALAKELLEKLSVTASVEIKEEEGGSFRIQIETEESGLLIGYHGEVINSLQLILGILIFRSLGEWVRVMVDVGDYREKREEVVKRMAQDKAAEVVASGLPVSLPYLSPLERRIIHMTLTDNDQVESVSEGDGKERHIVLKPRQQSA